MKLMIPDGELAGNTECVHVVAHARVDADLEALYKQLLPPVDYAKLLWPLESAAGWIDPPVYRAYNDDGRVWLVPEVFDNPSGLEAPAHVVIGLWGIAEGTPAADDARACPEL